MSAVTIDPLIRLRPSAELTEFIQYLHNDHPDLAMAASLAGKDLLTVQDIRWVYDQRHLLKDRDDSGVHFHDLMSDCQMVGCVRFSMDEKRVVLIVFVICRFCLSPSFLRATPNWRPAFKSSRQSKQRGSTRR